jgi:GAF domain-containing protein
VDAEHIRYIAQHPISIGRGSITGRVALDRRVIHVADVLADSEFDHHEWQTVGRQRTVLGVPLLLERSLIGVMILYRTEVAPFTDKQVELVETFADQAVIARERAVVRGGAGADARGHRRARAANGDVQDLERH